MELAIRADGLVHCVYDEAIELSRLGKVAIRRASHVEADATGQWTVDLSPVRGPILGGFAQRSSALAAEQEWLLQHWLTVHAETPS